MYKLCIEDDEGQQTIIPIIRDEITIGRQEGNTIRLTERNVSRRHARLLRQNQQVFIEEIAARYGVRKNGERIAQREPFKEGDIFLIGDYRLTLQSDAPPKAASPPAAAEPPMGFGAAPAPAARPEGTEVLPAKPAKLVVISSNFAGQEFPLARKEMVIGRGEECDIIIDHRSVSQKHAKVVRETGSTYQIIDLNSKNGVCIAGEKYTNVHLKRGDVVELGHVKFRFVEPGENYIFTPQGDDFDSGGATALSAPSFGAPAAQPASSGNGKIIGAIVGVVLVLAVVGGLFAAGIIGGGDKTKPTPDNKPPIADKNNATKAKTNDNVFDTSQSSNPKVADGIKKAKSYYDNGDMKQAIATLEALNNYANPSAEDKVTIGKLLSKARAEKAFESNYNTAKNSLKQDQPREALQAMNKIPPHSIYTKLLAEDKKKAIDGVMAMAQKAAKGRKYEQAKELLGDVLSADESNAQAKALQTKIEDRESEKPIASKTKKPNKTNKTKSKTNDIKLKPKPEKEPQYTAEELAQKLTVAQRAFINSKYSTALKECREILKARGSKDCYRVMGLTYNRMNNKPKACKYLGKAIKTNPVNAPALRSQMDKIGCD